LNQAGSYQNHHRVYGRADKPCSHCGELIQRTVLAQRSTFFCPKCQRKSHPRRA
jgi:formamidopyrimidine-DNA glycosylase